jgi:cell cycle arrest protein BUB3
LASLGDSSLVASAGWDSRFHLWDLRTSGGTAVSSITLPGKAFAMDFDRTHNRIVVATAGRRICFLDIRNSNTAELVLDRESSLKYQTRTVKFFPLGVGIALGSIEGRVAVEFLQDLGIKSGTPYDSFTSIITLLSVCVLNPLSLIDKSKYAFKCHRVGDIVFPVNCIDFHPKFGTFCTGGCDRTVVIWDGWNKKKLTTLPKFPTSIAALAFNEDGSQLAIASSYTFEEGEREHARDEIYVRQMLDSECQPKMAAD